MESHSQDQFGMERLLEALRLQIDEGVDEWILDEAQSRFDETKLLKDKKSEAFEKTTLEQKATDGQVQHENALAQPDQNSEEAEIDFSQINDDQEIITQLHAALSVTLRDQLHDALDDLGESDADIVVITDPPFREAVEKGDLLGDASTRLLRKSLQAVDIDFDASLGKEPRANLRILPISPWRMPQDRKFADHESRLFLEALRARLRISSHRLILLSGSNLAGLSDLIEDGKLFDLPVIELVSARAMLREALLKKLHWQRLLALHQNLDKYLSL